MADDRKPRRESPISQRAAMPCPLFLLRRTELPPLERKNTSLCNRAEHSPPKSSCAKGVVERSQSAVLTICWAW